MYFFLLLFFLHLKRSFQIDQGGGEANTRHWGEGGGGNQEVEGQNIPSGVSGGVRQSGTSDQGEEQGHSSGDHSITAKPPTTFSTDQLSVSLVLFLFSKNP